MQTRPSPIRTVFATGATFVLGWCLIGVAGSLLGRQMVPPPQAALDAAAGKPFDAIAVGAWLDRQHRPGEILAWAILPGIASILGVVASIAAPQTCGYVAPLSFLLLWRCVLWGERLDWYDFRFGLLYAGISAIVAILSVRVSKWLRQA